MSNSTPLRRPVLDTGFGFSPDLSIAIHRAQQAPIDRGQPLFADIVAQARVDFLVGARP